MRVRTGPEERSEASGVLGCSRLKILNDLSLRERSGEGKRGAETELLRYGLEKFVDRLNADRREHFLAFRRALGKITHQA
jgi:hypothetical protein